MVTVSFRGLTVTFVVAEALDPNAFVTPSRNERAIAAWPGAMTGATKEGEADTGLSRTTAVPAV
jgi:hypothetical protein